MGESRLTEEQWASMYKLLKKPDTSHLGVEILRSNIMGHEEDMLRAHFMIVHDRLYLQSTHNPFWSIIEELQEALWKLQAWKHVNLTRTEHAKEVVGLISGGGFSPGDRYMRSQQVPGPSEDSLRQRPVPVPAQSSLSDKRRKHALQDVTREV